MYKLVIKDDEGNKTVIAFYRQEVTVGRKAGNTIRLTEQNVSRTHAKLTKSNNVIFIEDQESYVGTFINGKLIDERTRVVNGDEILIGDYTITLINELTDDDETVLVDDETQIDDSTRTKKIVPVPISEITGEKKTKSKVNSNYTADSLKPPYAKIIFLDQGLEGEEYEITKTSMTIGKGLDCDIILNNKNISDKHAKFICDNNKSVKIKDLTPPNGVTINGDSYPISQLQEGDLVKFGDLTFRFCDSVSSYTYNEESLIIKQENNKKGLIIGAIALLAAAVTAFFIFSGKDKTDNKDKKKDDKIVKHDTNNKNKENKENKKEDVVKNDSPKLMNLKETGETLIKAKSWQKAEHIYLEILKIDPTNEDAQKKYKFIETRIVHMNNYAEARALFEKEEYKKSIDMFEALPKDTKYYQKYKSKKDEYFNKIYNEAGAKLDKNDYYQIEDYFYAANKIKPGDSDVIDMRKIYDKRLRKSGKKIKKKNTKKKNTKKKIKTKRDPELAKKLVKQARVASLSPSKKLKLAQKAMRADPSNIDAYYIAGRAAQSLNKKALARRYYKKTLNSKYKKVATDRLKELN